MAAVVEIMNKPQDQFFAIVHESISIRKHAQLFMWLQGDLQKLLPHDVLLVAYGDFSKGNLHYTVISSATELRTSRSSHADIEDLVTGLFDRWQNHGRTPYALDTTAGIILNSSCQCPLHRTLRNMRSVMVQGLRGEHAAIDVLYVAFRDRGSFDESTRKMYEILLPHIDCAARQVSLFAGITEKKETKHSPIAESSYITERETEILRWVSNGKTNYEIGIILGISPFTVKNHLQRIFRKIGVSNRAHAVSRYEEICRQQ